MMHKTLFIGVKTFLSIVLSNEMKSYAILDMLNIANELS